MPPWPPPPPTLWAKMPGEKFQDVLLEPGWPEEMLPPE